MACISTARCLCIQPFKETLDLLAHDNGCEVTRTISRITPIKSRKAAYRAARGDIDAPAESGRDDFRVLLFANSEVTRPASNSCYRGWSQ